MSIEDQYKEAAEIAEELKAPTTFDAKAAITGTTYPVDSIDIYSDAQLAHELNIVANEAAKARHLADSIKTGFEAKEHKSVEDSLEDQPGYADALAEATKLEAEVAELVAKLQRSVITFHVRGLAPAQWRLIDKYWRKEIKEPARKNFPQTEEGEEEFVQASRERNIERIAAIQNDQIAKAITKVVRKFDGAEDKSAWKPDDVASIHDLYLESEFDKLLNLVVQLTFANNLFQIAVEQDADFLSKP
ncbi:hypothetical protein [uncultured Arthrobacter sp.]|uniref:hypothetical protein n=1 Tax=uncultured Arthrobacter sp. TaxID=114050 RepID=UPI003217EE95